MQFLPNFSSKKNNSNLDPEINDKVNKYIKQLERDFPDLITEIDCFPSGSIMIDIHRNNKFFVLAYSPKQGFGVDEVQEDDYFDSGYSFVTQSSEEAFKQLRKIIVS